jgi:uncharacterized protein YoxC
MLNAVWVAVIVAVAFWAAGVSVAICLMVRAGRLLGAASATVSSLRERGDLLLERANATVGRAAEQVARAEAVTASMEGVTASMTELGDGLADLAAATRAVVSGVSAPLARLAALAFGVSRALAIRRAGRASPRWLAAGAPGTAARRAVLGPPGPKAGR